MSIIRNVPANYDCIVDASGNGDYSNIQDAITAGKKNIFIRAGNYVISSNLYIPSNTRLIGEGKGKFFGGSSDGVVFDLRSGISVYIVSTGASYVTTSTSGITINNPRSTVTVNGSSTNFIGAGLTAGDYIRFNGAFRRIFSVHSNTNLSLYTYCRGHSGVGSERVVAGTFVENVILENINFHRLVTYTEEDFVKVERAINCKIRNCSFEYLSTSAPYSANPTGFAGVHVLAENVEIVPGEQMTGFVQNVVIEDCNFNNLYRGVYTGSKYGSRLMVRGCTFDGMREAAIEVTGEYNQVIGNSIANSDTGVHIGKFAHNCLVSDNEVFGCNSGVYSDTGSRFENLRIIRNVFTRCGISIGLLADTNYCSLCYSNNVVNSTYESEDTGFHIDIDKVYFDDCNLDLEFRYIIIDYGTPNIPIIGYKHVMIDARPGDSWGIAGTAPEFFEVVIFIKDWTGLLGEAFINGTFHGGSQLKFTGVGQSVVLRYIWGKWLIVSNNGAVLS